MNWFSVSNSNEISTPSLLVYPQRVQANIEEMLKIAGGPERLRPHVKTYKMAEVIQLQQAAGIQKFKCATIAEAELLAQVGAKDILLAMQPVGPNIGRFIQLAKHFPSLQFSCLIDNEAVLNDLDIQTKKEHTPLGIFIDINNGMNRSGIAPSKAVIALYKSISDASMLHARGFHVYDGHLRIPSIEERKKACAVALQPVLDIRDQLESEGYAVETVVVGGSPTFPAHAGRKDIELSPGTVLLWDHGYGSKFSDMKFNAAAVLMTRIISKPAPGVLCLDLGHKSLASEMPFPRVHFLNTDDFEQVSQSEEHFVIKTPNSENYKVGDVFYAVPGHICPTVAKYRKLKVVEDGIAIGTWEVKARDHKITV